MKSTVTKEDHKWCFDCAKSIVNLFYVVSLIWVILSYKRTRVEEIIARRDQLEEENKYQFT